MADGDLSTRTEATSLSTGDLLYALIDPSGTSLDRKIAKENILKDLPADAVDAITEIAAALKSGSDGTLVTGTAGTDGNFVGWNADGDAVDSGSASSDFATAAQGSTADSALQDVVDDPSPQLGGDLDANGNTITGLDASTSAKGLVEVATAAETDTGTDTGRAVSPDALAGSAYGTAVVTLQLFDAATDVAVGDKAGDVLWRVPSTLNGFDLVNVEAYVDTAGTTGTTDVQVHNVTDTADMLSTKITIDSGETDTSTAATAPVIDTANDDVATGDKLRIDVDAVSTTAPKGLWVELQFRLP